MSKPSFLPTMALFRRRHPTLAEIEVLLDSLPQASLLLDLQANRILLANARATTLTAYTRAELTSLELSELLPAFADFLQQLQEGASPVETSLCTRSGAALEVFASLTRLGGQDAWALLAFESAAAQQLEAAERQRQAQRWEYLNELASAGQKDDAAQAVQTALEAGHRLTGAEILAVYLVDGQVPGLERTAGWGPVELLPEQIPAAEISGVLEPIPWVSGKRPLTSLHRAARAARLSYLAAAPLGQAGALSGALVIASSCGNVPEECAELLQVMAAALTTIIQNQAFRQNLLQERTARRRSLAIGELLREVNHEGVIVLSADLSITEMNPAAEQMLGYATREVAGQPIGNVLIGADNLVPALQAAQQGIPTPNLGNVRLHRRDGSAFLAHVRTLPVAAEEELKAVVVLLRDLSEREQFEVRNEQLEQRALLGEVTAIFAHEIRNPVNNISTGLQLLSMQLPHDDAIQEIIARLNQDFNRLTHLTQSILSFSRPPENKLEAVNLAELLPTLLERWRPRLVRLNVQHHVQHSGNATVMGDPRALEQVFNNLIGNAAQAMSATGGVLSINIRQLAGTDDRPQVEVSVSDNGPGIPEEVRERIFEPFFTTNRNGTGLGLAIARRIVTKHKGTIGVSSVPGGTVFQVLLPLASPA